MPALSKRLNRSSLLAISVVAAVVVIMYFGQWLYRQSRFIRQFHLVGFSTATIAGPRAGEVRHALLKAEKLGINTSPQVMYGH